MKRRLSSIIFLLIVLLSLILSVSGTSDDVAPYLNNTGTTSSSFSISSSGKATLSATYNAYSNVFTNAKVTSYIEKKTLGFFWTKVDIGQPNKEWVDTSTRYSNTIIHEFQLEDTGTYRATIVYEISGTGGATDIIEYEKERTYS